MKLISRGIKHPAASLAGRLIKRSANPGAGGGSGSSPARKLAAAQATYYVTTALWALVDIRSFQKVTGRKTDLWLVKTVALMLIQASLSMMAGLRRQHIPRETAFAGLSSAAAIASVDYYYSLKGEISPIYLLDGLVETVFITMWLTRFVKDGFD